MPMMPTTVPASSRISETAWTSSMSVIEGVARTARASVSSTARPVASPWAWTIRRRLWAASSPSAIRPSAARSKGAPSPASHSISPGAALAMRAATSGSERPAPAVSVSAAWRSGWSSAPSAAAMPPCAQAVAASSPRFTRATSVTGSGARRSAVASPATPPPTTMTPSVVCVSMRKILSGWRACVRPPRGRDRRRADRSRRLPSSSRARGGSSGA